MAEPEKQRAVELVGRAQQRLTDYISDEDFVQLLRVLQLAVVRGNLESLDVPQLGPALAEEFPANHVRHVIANSYACWSALM